MNLNFKHNEQMSNTVNISYECKNHITNKW